MQKYASTMEGPNDVTLIVIKIEVLIKYEKRHHKFTFIPSDVTLKSFSYSNPQNLKMYLDDWCNAHCNPPIRLLFYNL